MDNDGNDGDKNSAVDEVSKTSTGTVDFEGQDDLETDGTLTKRRRKSSSAEGTSTSPPAHSNLTVKNLADHVKRYEEEDRQNKDRNKENVGKSCDRSIPIPDQPSKTNGACGELRSIDVCSNVGSINLDEMVDNFSTMATDGSRHSFCDAACEDESVKDQEKSIGSGTVLINYQEDVNQKQDGDTQLVNPDTESKMSDSVLPDFFAKPQETVDDVSEVGKDLDDDGNVANPDEIGEPNEVGLGHWEPECLQQRYSKVNFGGDDDELRDSDGVSDRSAAVRARNLTSSPAGRVLVFETASTTPTRDDAGEESLNGGDRVVRRRRGTRPRFSSSSDDDEDAMLTSRSCDEAAPSSNTGDVNEIYTPPPHKWNAVKAWRQREFGMTSNRSPHWFRYYANGSLHFVQRLELMYKMEAHDGCVNCLHFNESGTRLASGSDDLNVIIWDWTTKTPLLTVESGHRANVFQAKFMPLSGDCHLVTCARDGQVRLVELSVRGVCKSTRKLAQHRGSSHKLTLESDSPHTFLSCGDDAVVFELDLRDPKPNKLLTCKERRADGNEKVPLYSIHSHPRNPTFFAVSGRDPYCRIYDKRMIVDGSEPVKKFCPQHLVKNEPRTNVTAVVFSHDGSELLGTYNDDDIYLFDTEQPNQNEYKHCYKGHRNNATVKGVNFYGPRSEFIVSGSDCGYIYFWEKESETVVQFMPGDEGGVVNVLEPHPTCAMLATSGLDHDVKIWVPSCEDPKFDAKLLQKLMRQNASERDRDRRNEPELLDSQMLWYIMSRMRRAARRAQAQQGEASDESGPDGSDDTDNTDADEDAGDGNIQCRPS